MVSNFQTVFTAETVFHNEVSKVYAQLVDMMEKLAIENQKGTYMQRKPDSPSQKRYLYFKAYFVRLPKNEFGNSWMQPKYFSPNTFVTIV